MHPDWPNSGEKSKIKLIFGRVLINVFADIWIREIIAGQEPSVILLKKHATNCSNSNQLKLSHNCLKVKTVTDSQTKTLFCNFCERL